MFNLYMIIYYGKIFLQPIADTMAPNESEFQFYYFMFLHYPSWILQSHPKDKGTAGTGLFYVG